MPCPWVEIGGNIEVTSVSCHSSFVSSAMSGVESFGVVFCVKLAWRKKHMKMCACIWSFSLFSLLGSFGTEAMGSCFILMAFVPSSWL